MKSRAYKGLILPSKKVICKNDIELGQTQQTKLMSMVAKDRIRLFQSIQKSNNQIIDYFIKEHDLEEKRFIEAPETPNDSESDHEEETEFDGTGTQPNPE